VITVEDGKQCPAGHPQGRWWAPRKGCRSCEMDHLGDRLADRLATDVDDVTWDEVRAAVEVATTWSQRRRELFEAAEADLSWLRSGISSAPFASRRLIQELTRRGAAGLALPRCAGCGLQRPLPNRQGPLRVCNGCRQQREAEPCAHCGRLAAVAYRDDERRPWCRSCRAKDPGTWRVCGRCRINGPVSALHEGVPLCQRCYQPPIRPCGFCDQPSAIATHLSVNGRRVPTCARCGCHDVGECTICGRRAPLYGTRQRIARRCGRCWHAEQGRCPRCHRTGPLLTEPHSLDKVCAACFTIGHRGCGSCGSTQHRIKRRGADSEPDLCELCWRGPRRVCARCGQLRRCPMGRAVSPPACAICVPRRPAPCGACGQTAEVHQVLTDSVRCRACFHAEQWQLAQRRAAAIEDAARPMLDTRERSGLATLVKPDGWQRSVGCADCGHHQSRYNHGRCQPCRLRAALDCILTDPTARAALEPWCAVLIRNEHRNPRWPWLVRHEELLTELGSGRAPISHAGLDSLPASRTVEWLRSQLVATGCLPRRALMPAVFESWLGGFVQTVPDTETRQLLNTYGRWRLLPTMRRRATHTTLSYVAFQLAKGRIRTAATFLDALRAQGLPLDAITQADLEEYLVAHPRSQPHLEPFIRWAVKAGSAGPLVVPRLRRTHPKPLVGTEERWVLLRRFLHDDTLQLADRVAGALVLLYGQTLSRLLTLTVAAVQLREDGGACIRFDREWVILPAPLAGLAIELRNTRHHPRATLRDVPSLWLFPGTKAGQAASHAGSIVRLRKAGLHPGPGRRRALIHHAQRTEVPILARLLGMTPATAQKWSERAGNEFGGYTGRAAPQGHTLKP